jgi:hypothetical protein
VHSPTLNEPAHLAAGVSHWQLRRFELYRVNPPLARLAAALPVLVAGCETDWSALREGPGARPEFDIGRRFVELNSERVMTLFTIARFAGPASCMATAEDSLQGKMHCANWSTSFLAEVLTGNTS